MGKPALVSASPLTTPNFTEFAYDSFEEAFPTVDPGIRPFGFVGIFQIRQPKHVTKGGILIVAAVEGDQHYNTQVAKVVALGPLCFKTVQDGALLDWPEGRWFKIGDYVRVPKFGGDRFYVNYKRETAEQGEKLTIKDQAIFACFKVKDILGLVTDPLAGMAYLD